MKLGLGINKKIMMAIHHYLMLVIMKIVENGADVNDACRSRNKNIVIYLVENGTNVNKEIYDSNTLWFNVCKSRNENIIKYLVIDNGADINKGIRK